MRFRRALVLAAAGAVLLVLTLLGAALPGLQEEPTAFVALAAAQSLAYLAAVAAVWNGAASRRLVFAIAAVALLLRLPLLVGPPHLSTDIYRYIWDGRVQAAGINPYRYVPNDPNLEHLRDAEVFPEINRSDSAVTIYPPAAEAIFLAVTRISESVSAMKAAMVGFEVVTFVLLLRLLAAVGRPVGRVAVYAWHPLPLWEFAGSGHIDAALITFTVAALWMTGRGRGALTGLFLALATLTKLYPAVLLPALYRRWRWALPVTFAAVIAGAYLPYLGIGRQVLGYLPGYAAEEGFNAGGSGFYLLALLRHLPGLGGMTGQAYAAVIGVLLVALAAAIAYARDEATPPFAAAAVLGAAFMVAVSPHYPWYFAWLIVFACFVRSFALFWLTTACLLLYLVPVGAYLVRNDYRLVVESIIYGPFAALALVDVWYHRRHAFRSA